MIATATINGVIVEASGTPEECYSFFDRAFSGYQGKSIVGDLKKFADDFNKRLSDFVFAHPADNDVACSFGDYIRSGYKGESCKLYPYGNYLRPDCYIPDGMLQAIPKTPPHFCGILCWAQGCKIGGIPAPGPAFPTPWEKCINPRCHSMRELHEHRQPNYNVFETRAIQVCDPLARHRGNCGADDCPIIT